MDFKLSAGAQVSGKLLPQNATQERTVGGHPIGCNTVKIAAQKRTVVAASKATWERMSFIFTLKNYECFYHFVAIL